MAKRNQQNNKGLITLLFVLIAIFLILVIVLLLVIFADRLKSGNPGVIISPEPQVTVNPEDKTPVKENKPTEKPSKSDTPTPVPATSTPTSTPTPTNTPTPAMSVQTGFGEALDKAASELYDQWKADKSNTKAEVYDGGYYASVVFSSGDDINLDYPVTFVKETGEVLTIKSFIRETYLAVIKERLQSYVLTVDDAFKDSEFITYKNAYRASDYEKFYIKGDKLIFLFPKNTLTDNHKAFYYECDLSGATPYMYVNTDGETVGKHIRMDLDPNKPMIALTFDDGPRASVEEKFFDIIEKYNASFTFFSVGNRFSEKGGWTNYMECLKQLSDAGCEISSHTYSHDKYGWYHDSFFKSESNYKTFWQELNKNSEIIASTTGCAPEYIRMPGGCYAEYMTNVPSAMVNWSLDSHDWEYHGKQIKMDEWTGSDEGRQKVYEAVLSAKDGDVILMHSIYLYSVEGAEMAMKELAEKGYQFVNLSELFYYKGIEVENGKLYNKGR